MRVGERVPKLAIAIVWHFSEAHFALYIWTQTYHSLINVDPILTRFLRAARFLGALGLFRSQKGIVCAFASGMFLSVINTRQQLLTTLKPINAYKSSNRIYAFLRISKMSYLIIELNVKSTLSVLIDIERGRNRDRKLY
jgi:hypothetical protein